MNRTAVINVVGLTRGLVGEQTPVIQRFLRGGAWSRIAPAFPAVTCTAQSNYLTGKPPSAHGIVANGWYDRDIAMPHFWKQSNSLVQQPRIWETLKTTDSAFTCAQLFWWFNMYTSVDWSLTPRPIYPADGRKVFDIHTWPYSIRSEIKEDLGVFPFPAFWGPAAGVDTRAGSADAVSRWISRSAMWIEEKHRPTLNLVYLPHLDYNLQRLGPGHPEIASDLRRIDRIIGELIDFFTGREIQVVLLSEYGITPAEKPVHLNRIFREKGWLTVKDELGLEMLDYGASRAFAIADHQVAHIYLNDPSISNTVRATLEATDGVAAVLNKEEKIVHGIAHPRAGNLIAVSNENAWFTYYYWMDDAVAPDFARCVDIHRKPGYDPVELFLDPDKWFIGLRMAWKLLKSRLGLRMLMDVIPLDATLVKGSHGCRPNNRDDWPLFITQRGELLAEEVLDSTAVHEILQRHIL